MRTETITRLEAAFPTCRFPALDVGTRLGRLDHMPSLFVASVLAACPNIDTIAFGPFVAPNDGHRPPKRDGDDYAFSVLLAQPLRLTSITYTLQFSVDRNTVDSRCSFESPQIQTLGFKADIEQVEGYGSSPPEEYLDLIDAVASLKKLETLTLGIPIPLERQHLQIQSPLRKLAYDAFETDIPTSFWAFLSTFSDTLIELELRYPLMPKPPGSLDAVPAPFHLPHLAHLIISSCYPIDGDEQTHPYTSPYPYLSASPIQTLHIDAAGPSCIPHILSFIDCHQKTLWRVEWVYTAPA